MHTMILANEHKLKEIMREEFEDALEEEDLETLHMILDMECILQELKEDGNPHHNPGYGNPGHTMGTADIKSTGTVPHGHGVGTVQFTTTP